MITRPLETRAFAGAPETRALTCPRPDPNVAFRALSEERRATEAASILSIKIAAVPPVEMMEAPIAPAQSTKVLVQDYEVTRGGIRQQVGAHWQADCMLRRMNAGALQRHQASGSAAPFLPPFAAGHLVIADLYRGLVEWREGSALKCASIEAGRGGGGDGSEGYMVRFIKRGRTLADLHQAIGLGVALRVQRDGSGGRRSISVRALVDLVVLQDCDLTDVLRRHGWAKLAANRHALRHALREALDRMCSIDGTLTD